MSFEDDITSDDDQAAAGEGDSACKADADAGAGGSVQLRMCGRKTTAIISEQDMTVIQRKR